jgi:hypothetical protein
MFQLARTIFAVALWVIGYVLIGLCFFFALWGIWGIVSGVVEDVLRRIN